MTERTQGFLPRELAARLEDALSALPVVVLTGLRQAGKTTLLTRDSDLGKRRFVTLDDFAVLAAARRDPEALIAGDDPLTIDEVQRCPELLIAIKRAVDRDRRPGQFLLSGSANLALLHGVGDSLAGRALYLELQPMSRREIRGALEQTPWLIRLLAGHLPVTASDGAPITSAEVLDGGFPPVALGASGREAWFLGYEQTYLERDVRELSQVADLVEFRTVMRLAALRTGQILNQSELARDAGLPVKTASRYLGLLETSFVVRRLAPYLASRTLRLIKSPKLSIGDSGLAGHLANVGSIEVGDDEPMRGALFETYVAQNLVAILGAHAPRAEVGFWNVQGRHEVDFVVIEGKKQVAIEVKAGTRFRDSDLKGLEGFLREQPAALAGILAYNGTSTVPLGDRLFAVPISTLLS